MAKKQASVKTTPPAPKNPELVRITSADEESLVISYNKEGRVLSFDGEDFRPLSEPAAADLSHDNARRYWMAYGVWKDRKRKPERAVVEKILDPLAGHEGARLTFTPRGDEGKEFLKRNHLAWMFSTTVPGMKQLGYKEVHEDDPVDVGISSNASGYYLTRDLQGRDELLLMKIDMQRFREHERAVVAKSQRAIKGAREDFEGKLDALSHGKVKPMRESEEDQTVEKVRVTPDTVNRAFVADKK